MKQPLMRALLAALMFALVLAACGGTESAPVATPANLTSPAAPTTAPTATPLPEPTATAATAATTASAPTNTPAPPPASVSGQVLWGAEPVPHARIELRAPGWRDSGEDQPIAAVDAGAAGQFLLAAVPPGEYAVVAVWPDGEPGAGVAPVVTLAAGQSLAHLTLALARPLALLEPDFSEPAPTLPTVHWEPQPDGLTYRVRITDAATGETVVDEVVTSPRFDVLDQLQPAYDYTLEVSALDAAGAALALATADFTTSDVPSPPRAVALPQVCRQPGLPAMVVREFGLCFAYPADYAFSREEGPLTLIGPPVSASLEPLFASLTAAAVPAAGQSLAAWVDGYVAGFSELPVEIGRIPTTVGGREALILEPVPGRLSAREVALDAGNDTIIVLTFWPSFRDTPPEEWNFEQRRAQTEADELFETVMATLAYLPPPGEAAEGALELPGPCLVAGMGLYVDAEAGLCVAIPPGFTAQRTPQGLPRLIGPALDETLSPVRASFALEPPEDAAGRTLAETVEDFLATLGDDEVAQTEMTVAGEPAVLLEGITAGRGSQQLVLIHEGQVYRLVFQPSPAQVPVAEDDMARLMDAVAASFSFLNGGE